jgi:magnesium chelatase accessory protein
VRDLPKLKVSLPIITGADDWAISSAQAFRMRALVPAADVKFIRGLGHQAHEESPGEIVHVITRFAAAWQVLADAP